MALRPLRHASRIKPPPRAIDYSADPILQQIRALTARNDASAQAGNLAARKQALESYGYDPALKGLYGDPGTQGTAQQNPFSTLAILARAHTQRQTDLNQNYNKANLFYSSARGQALQNEGTQYLGEQAGAAQKLQDFLTGLASSLAAEQQGSQQQIVQAEEDAYNRALQNSLKYGGVAATKPLSFQQRIRQVARKARLA